MGMGNLPSGWIWTTLEDCVDILDNRRVPINAEERQQRISGKSESNLYPYFGATGKVGLIDDFIFDEEIVLLGEDGAPFLDFGKDKAYLVRGKSWVNNHAHVLKAKKGVTTNPFLMHYLNLFEYRDYVTGTTRLKLNQTQMRRFPVILPPLPEQERIVAKIEELFTQLEVGTAALKRVQAGLKRYKASALKAAVKGRLFDVGAHSVRPWDDKASGAQAGRTPSARTGELSQGWRWVKVKDAGKVQLGRQHAPQHHQGDHMRPYLRVANVFEDRLDLSDVKEMNFTPAEYEIYKLEYGDILLNEGQSPELLGRPAMYKGEVPGSCFQNTLIRFQAYAFVDRHFALIVFRHYMHAGRFTNESQITTNIAHLSAGRFSEIEFPLPPLAEQQRIVAEVDRRLEGAQEVESVVAAALARASRLRQTILKNAFEGKLS